MCSQLPRCATPLRRRVRTVRYLGGYYGNATEEAIIQELEHGPVAVSFYAEAEFPLYSEGAPRPRAWCCCWVDGASTPSLCRSVVAALVWSPPVHPTYQPVMLTSYASSSLLIYIYTGIFSPVVERNYWKRMLGRTLPAFDAHSCHSGCAPPARLEWQSVNHAASLIGYGSEQVAGETVDYWILQLSWGQDWGEAGYARVRRGETSVIDTVAIDPFV